MIILKPKFKKRNIWNKMNLVFIDRRAIIIEKRPLFAVAGDKN